MIDFDAAKMAELENMMYACAVENYTKAQEKRERITAAMDAGLIRARERMEMKRNA